MTGSIVRSLFARCFVTRRFVARRFVVLALTLIPAWSRASLETSTPEKEKNEPLVMENADRFEGYRSRGEYVLSGKVRFSHGTLRLETERAVWQKDRNIVLCEAGMKITQRGAVLTADRGSYDKNLGQATAEGHVFMRDSSGEVEASGRNIVYMRYRHLTTLTGNPELRRFYVNKDSSDSSIGTAKAGPPKPGATAAASKPTKDSARSAVKTPRPIAKAAAKLDTLRIRGDVMTYDDSTQVAVADGKVRIDREKLKITCKKAEYHNAADSLFLLGDPLVILDDNQVKGQIMRLGMHGEDIRSLLVKGAAQAHSLEPATDTSSARQSDVQGDSLFLAFKDKAIDSVQVFKNATGTYYDIDKPEYLNKMSGTYMVLRFMDKQIASANVLGGGSGTAKSTYYHFEKKSLKGRNDAEGDTIDFAFRQGKVDEVRVKGQAKGTYFGERQGKASKDSAAAPAPAAKGAGAQPAQPSEPWRKK